MTPTSSYQKNLEKARRAADQERYDLAFTQIDRLLQAWPDNPHLLVQWANLLQLQEDDKGPSIEDAKAALKRAVALDEQSPMPLIELGHYLYALDDDAEAASKTFARAITLCKSLLREALVGQAKALGELERKHEALACLAEAYWLQSHNGTAANGEDSGEILEQLKDLALAH